MAKQQNKEVTMKLNQPHYIEKREGACHLSLVGQWQFGYTDDTADDINSVEYSYAANVPDSLFWNLYEAGVMPHPYEGLNSRRFHWVDEKVWYYRKKFRVDEALKGRSALLCFDGIAYYSRIWLNNILLGEHEGMFAGPYVSVAPLLNYGEDNELVVEVKACNYGKKETYDGWNEKGENREIVPWNTVHDRRTSNGDWIIMGLWRSVRLEFPGMIHLGRPYLVTERLEDGRALLRLETEIIEPDLDELHAPYAIYEDHFQYNFAYTPGLREAYLDVPCSVLVRLVEKKSGKCSFEEEYPVRLLDYAGSIRAKEYPESQYFEKEFYLEHPRLWWPHDMGEPFLYTVELVLKVDGEISDRLSFDFGVRTIELERTAGGKARSGWEKYQFVINKQKVFLKGVNWMPQDALYREEEREYEWSLKMVKNAGIHLVRIWSGGGTPESDAFYRTCDEMGIMVWQDHFIANTCHTEGWPQDILEDQESANLYRLRNHPSLAVHCGGNEFNSYSAGNAASLHVIRRTVEMLDPQRKFYDTTPLKGSAHIYNDMEPSWYRHLYKDLPFVAETGIHSLPNYKAMKRFLNEKECTEQIPDLTSEEFQQEFPEFLNHFTEYVPERVPRMLARASQITDLEHTNLAGIIEATQLASCEYYEILVQALRENYPVTSGVMPWVFRRTWPTAGIQLVDGTGEPVAPYYYLKNAYRNVEAHLALEQVSFAPGETVKIPVRLCNEYHLPLDEYSVKVRAWSPQMSLLWEKTINGPDTDGTEFILEIAHSWEDKFFFLTIDLFEEGKLMARQAYWPKCLSVLKDPQTLKTYRTRVQENFRLKNGPWLKDQVKSCENTELQVEILKVERKRQRAEAKILVQNTGKAPAFPVSLQVTDPGTRALAQDNWFWLDAGETRTLRLEIDSPEEIPGILHLCVSAWNSKNVLCFM